MNNETTITKGDDNKTLLVTRAFKAPLDKVWRAWTEADLLDQWWAPKPWKAETKDLEFTEGGRWLYSMNGPKGERSWCRVEFRSIDPGKSFSTTTGFTDEAGETLDPNFPVMYWNVTFEAVDGGTLSTIIITFDTEADLEQIVNMGFKEGFTMGLGNLDELLAS
jgi:uncharacterized protein YndB with AHSA1/START domain